MIYKFLTKSVINIFRNSPTKHIYKKKVDFQNQDHLSRSSKVQTLL